MIWNETIECMDREEMRKLQSLRLKRVVEHAYHNSPFYRKKMQEMGITPDDVQTIDDITKLPFTVKQDLRDNYPFGLMAVPMSEIVRLHASSGTTGKPIVVEMCIRDRSISSRTNISIRNPCSSVSYYTLHKRIIVLSSSSVKIQPFSFTYF